MMHAEEIAGSVRHWMILWRTSPSTIRGAVGTRAMFKQLSDTPICHLTGRGVMLQPPGAVSLPSSIKIWDTRTKVRERLALHGNTEELVCARWQH